MLKARLASATFGLCSGDANGPDKEAHLRLLMREQMLYSITYSGFTNEMRRVVERIALKDCDWRNIHDLRHTAATDVLRASRDIAAARDMLSHSDIKMTEKCRHSERPSSRGKDGPLTIAWCKIGPPLVGQGGPKVSLR